MRLATWTIGATLCALAGCGSELAGPGARDADADSTADVDSAADTSIGPDLPELPDSAETLDADPDGDDGDGGADTHPEVHDTGDGDIGDTFDTGPELDGDDGDGDTLDADPETEADTAPADTLLAWRSELYPEDWEPGHAAEDGAALQDFSYAGYHNGEAPLGAGLGPDGVAGLARFDVTDFGAVAFEDPSASVDATAAFQDAIDAATAAGGGVVYVPAGLYRLDFWLEVRSSRIVIAGDGPDLTKLWFTRQAGLSYAGHIQVLGEPEVTHETLLAEDGEVFDETIAVTDATGLNVGEDVVLGHQMTAELLEAMGMSERWAAVAETWQPRFFRTIVGVDRASTPPRITIDVPLRAPLAIAHGASLRRVGGLVREVGVEDLGIANATAWEVAWRSDKVAAILFVDVADGWVRNVRSFVSPGAPATGPGAGAHLQSNGIVIARSKRVTIADCHLAHAQNRGYSSDGYLFDVLQSNEVLTRDSSARGGRNNFIASAGFGTAGAVWLRVRSEEAAQVPLGPISDSTIPTRSELHSLATANLVDHSVFLDGFDAMNREGALVDGPGHGATASVFWNFQGGEVISLQYGLGYVIGSAPGTRVTTSLALSGAIDTEPEDWVEGVTRASTLEPASLYEDQLARRLGSRP